MRLRSYDYTYKRTVEPTIEPVTLTELQNHVLGYNSSDTTYLTELIQIARSRFEQDTGLALLQQTWEMVFPSFPEVISIHKAPVRSITSITYYDGAGDSQTVTSSDYRYADHGLVTRITPAIGASWPSVESGRPDAAKVTFVAGVYAIISGSPDDSVDTSTSPQTNYIGRYMMAQQAIKILCSHLYENRSIVAPVQLHEAPMAYQAMVNACRVV